MFAKRDYCLPNFSCIVGRMAPEWERLGQYVLDRRTGRGWSQEEVAERGGPSDTLQTEIEAKRWKPRRSVRATLNKIDLGMEWAFGSSSAILAGGEPSEAHSERPFSQSHAVNISNDGLVHELFQLWEGWRDLTLDIMQRPGFDADIVRRGRRALILTADVVLDLSEAAIAGAQVEELRHDVSATMSELFDRPTPIVQESVTDALTSNDQLSDDPQTSPWGPGFSSPLSEEPSVRRDEQGG